MLKRFFKVGVCVVAFLLALGIAGSVICFENPDQLNYYFRIPMGEIVTPDADSADTLYYKSSFGDGTLSSANLKLLIEETYQQNVNEMREGAVLLKNENDVLPLKTDERNISLSGSQIDEPVNMGNGSGDYIIDLKTALSDAGFSLGGGNVALYMISRSSGEGSEFAMVNASGVSALALQESEKKDIKALKAAGYSKIIVLLNTTNPIEMDWAYSEEYGVDAVLWIGGPGYRGFIGVAELLTGKSNPSGHLVDTYAAISTSAPACANGSANSPRWTNYQSLQSKVSDAVASIAFYNVQAESIYVGYKYYETRYEDAVLGRYGATAAVGSSFGEAWNYADEVTYPFGYGLSYTKFEQTLDSVEDNEDGTLTAKVTVTNTGEVAGKSVVQVYAQTPYGVYERENLVEKSAVQLVAYGKTDLLEVGASQQLSIEINKYFLASYDYIGAKGYILSEGEYFLAIGDDCHDALNNILAAKDASGMTDPFGNSVEGDTFKAFGWTERELDTETYRNSVNEKEVTNRFSDCDINAWIPNAVRYMSRQDWAGTYPQQATALTVTDEMIEVLDGDTYEKPQDAPAYESFTQGARNGITAFEMRGVDYDDERWNQFLDQLTLDELATLLPDLRVKNPIQSIVLPSYLSNNGPDAVSYSFSEEKYGAELARNCCRYCDQEVLASTWNKKIQKHRGEMMGEELLFCGLYQVYAPGANLHRTPFGGRNCEYWSEDATLTYFGTTEFVSGVMSKGVNCQIKHLAGNDQECYRQGICVFFTEQGWREGALRAFEGALTEGGGLGCMNGLNRIGLKWTNASSALCIDVLRGEWGFKGTIDTDGISMSYQKHYVTTLAAGTTSYDLDGKGTSTTAILGYLRSEKDGYILMMLREAAKNKLYPIVNSSVMNGLTANSSIASTGTPFWESAIYAVLAVLAVMQAAMIAGYVVFSIKECKRRKQHESNHE